MGNTAGDHPGETAPPKQRGWLYRAVRWALAKWWWLEISVLLLGLLTNILLFPLGQGLDQWGQGVTSQVAALLALPGTRPITFIIAVMVVLALSVAGKLADRALKRDEEEKRQHEHLANTKIAVTQAVGEPLKRLEDDVATVRQGIEQLTRRPPDFPPGVIAPTGLPRAAAFVGREETLADLMTKLRSGQSLGIFALAGMGGIGKTALAAEVVARLATETETFPGGAAWIACEGLTGESGLAELWTRVARALGLEQVAALPDPAARRAALSNALAQHERLLLALDNLEPKLEAETALEALSVPGKTALLLTARQKVAPHKLQALIELHPLPDPDAQRLFTQRLHLLDETRPTAEDMQVLPALLALLGGLPLALELTAAYLGVQRLSLARLLRELETDGLNALAYSADPRRALLKRFERSWAVLSARQQRLFAGLSLLAGTSFPREAALAVAHPRKQAPVRQGWWDRLLKRKQNALPIEDDEGEFDPPGDLLILVSYALVEALPGGERLRLHPLLREYAAGKLKTFPPKQQARLGDAMVAFWLAYAQAHPGYDGMDALEAEAAGLMGALDWSHAQARRRELLALVKAIWQAWRVRGRRDETLQMYVWANEVAQTLSDLVEQRIAIHQLALTQHDMGRLSEARAGYERALVLARQLSDSAAEWDEVHQLAVLDYQQGRLAEARAGFERALVLARQLGDPASERADVHELALVDQGQGRLAEARAGFERALVLARQLGDPAVEWDEVGGLAVLDAQQGRLAEARAGYERALSLARQLSDPAAEQEEVHGLAVLDDQQGRLSEARAGYERALSLARQLSDPAAEADELLNLGLFIGQHGGPEQGRQMIAEALAISERLSNIYNIGTAHQFLAWLDERGGNGDAAIAHLREALRCFEQVQSPNADEVRASLRKLGAGK